jgi:MoaA/NifB/PqqE/SkfB family radical SAM enzyme
MNKKENSKLLYQAYGEKMCLAPFLNSFYSTTETVELDKPANNTVRPCSLIHGYGNDWHIQNNSISETRNNEIWVNLRRSFLEGKFETITRCSTCIEAERQGASSARQLNNDYLFEHLDIDIISEMQKIIDNNLKTSSVFAMDYFPSSFCNYACIMCHPGASTARTTFAIKIHGKKLQHIINPVDSDFYDMLKNIKILGFTGGETIMQPEVHNLLDYLIANDLAKEMIITILTNLSDFPDTIVEKFNHFKKVLYTISIDGVGEVIEYQRRGADWPTVEKNALKLRSCSTVHEIVNHVVTAVNILNAMDFIDWCHNNDFKFIVISAVFQQNTLGSPALPPELKTLALQRLQEGRKRYEHYLSSQYKNYQKNWVTTIDLLINTLENTQFDPAALKRFVKHIKLENQASKKPLHEVVPEWAPWFVN